jgi:hypothetical protein
MSTNVYQVARHHATTEISEINAQIEQLTQRKGLIEKLLGLFEQLDSPSTGSFAPEVADTPLPE